MEGKVELEQIVTGFAFIEAPRVDEQGNLYFSDVMLGGVHRRSADGQLKTVLPDRRWVGGIALNDNGAIICGGHGGLWYFDERTGDSLPLLTEIAGKAINAVNDIQPDGAGGLYFGTIDGRSLAAGTAPEPGALYHLAPSGHVTLLVDKIPMSNGLGLSPDGGRLYHSRTFEGLWSYEIAEDGSLMDGRLLAGAPDCDGLAVDAQGGIWMAACRSGVIRRYLPSGKIDRVLEFPIKEVLSLTFGGDDLCDLYVATAYPGAIDTYAGGEVGRAGSVLRVRSDIPGQPMARTRFAPPSQRQGK